MKRFLLLFCLLVLTAASKYKESIPLDNFIAARNPTLWLDSSDSSTVNVSPPSTGLVTHFHMEDNAADTVVVNSGSGANGVSANNTSTYSATGKINLGLNFDDANDDAIDLGSDTIGTGADSFSFWLNLDNAGESNSGMVLNNGKTIILPVNNNQINFYSNGSNPAQTTNTLTLAGQWNHIALTRTAGAVANCYVNGVLSGAANQNITSIVAGDNNTFIGNRAANDRGLDGKIDDFRHYSRILSPSEIKSLYNSGVGTHGPNPDPDLVTHLSMNNSAADTVVTNYGTGVDGVSLHNTDTTFTTGKIDGALDFHNDGAGDYVTITDWNGITDFTFCTWEAADTDGGQDLGNFFNNGDSTPYFSFNGNALWFSDGGAINASWAIDAPDGTWQHICLTREGTSGIAYVNGVSLGAETVCADAFDASIFIGTNDAGLARYFDGDMDDVRMYSRVLTPSEIAEIYAAGNGTDRGSYPYVAGWKSKYGSVNFTQGTAANQPTYTAYQNGRHVVDFELDNAETLTSTSTTDDLFNADAKTLFIVYKPETVATNQFVLSVTTNRYVAYLNSANFRVQNHDGGNDLTDTGQTFTAAQTDIAWHTHDGAVLAVSVVGADAATTSSGDTSTMAGTLYLCGNSAGANTCDGQLMELITFDSVLPQSDIRVISLALQKKWGINPSFTQYVFQPSDLDDITSWFRGDSGVTITGSGVSAWADKTAQVNDFVQGTDANRPTITAVSGHDCVDFDRASAHYMTNASDLDALFANNAKTQFLVLSSDSAVANTRHPFRDTNSDWIVQETESTIRVANDDGGIDLTNFVSFTPAAYTATITHDGTNLKLWVNGGSLDSVASGNTADLSGTLSLGVDSGGTDYYDGQFCEFITYDRVLSAAEIALVEEYLRQRYSIY